MSTPSDLRFRTAVSKSASRRLSVSLPRLLLPSDSADGLVCGRTCACACAWACCCSPSTRLATSPPGARRLPTVMPRVDDDHGGGGWGDGLGMCDDARRICPQILCAGSGVAVAAARSWSAATAAARCSATLSRRRLARLTGTFTTGCVCCCWR